jgi:ABC-2 type transport system ATP-binding protein
MKKRIEIAKLFIQRPEVAIFDEPTSQIDVSGKHKIWNMIKSLRDDGSTIILATNELYEADILSDRVGIIHKGRIVALGSPAELKDMIPGGDILEIVVDRFIPDAVRSKLESIPEVSRLSVANGMLRLYLNKAEEILPNVIQLLMSNDIRVKSVNMREPTLNDVFLHFTGTTIKEAEEGGN